MPLAGYAELLQIAGRSRWSAETLDLDADRRAWPAVAPGPRAAVASLLAGFLVGEHAVARDIAAFAPAAPSAELAACLAAQADDEHRHRRFVERAHAEVLGEPLAAARARVPPQLSALFEHELADQARRLLDAPDELPQAVALYHGTLEGVVFLAGQAELIDHLEAIGRLPGLLEGMRRMQRDERWHVALGARVLAELGAALDLERMRHSGERALAAWGEAVSPAVRSWALGALERRLRTVASAARQSARPDGAIA